MSDQFLFDGSIRDVITSVLPEDTSLHGQSPELRYTYLPATHAKSLRPENMLVVGIRGAGKSFWWSALQNPQHREMFGPSIGLQKDSIVSIGFGETPNPNEYPGKDTLSSLLNDEDPRLVWRTVVFRQIVGSQSLVRDFVTLKDWENRVRWVREHPEIVEKELFRMDDEELDGSNRYHLVLFDALDRTADDWKAMNRLVRGLLQTVLDFRSYRRIRLKVFARPDQIEDSEVGTFPDASKILSQKTELYWPRNELYALLWQYLSNAENGHVFREGVGKLFSVDWKQRNNVWLVPDSLRNDEAVQRELFHAMTGPWMGRDRRRGFPYTWLPNHLGDTRNQVSPRSFLASVRHAASDRVRQEHRYAIHYESIKAGVQQASRIRVQEMQEDYPWVQNLLSPLAALSVPCPIEDVKRIWQSRNILQELSSKIASSNVRLPPAHFSEGADGVLKDLANLGLIERLSGGRINIPDVYRVGYGIGRRGGVKPAAR
uniref:Uncharacterized protein n=1 Tax=Desulfatirhabdium butyrativorans TaxID=340467 RepID=A0A7C4RRR4_9BACT